MAEPARVLVLAPNWLGDAVMALPALDAIRARYPAARLLVAARRGVAGLFELAPQVDEIVGLAWDGRWWRPAPLVADAGRLRACGADVAVLLPNSFASALLAWAARVPVRVGYGRNGRSWLLTRAVDPPRPLLHQSAYYTHLVAALGGPAPAGPPAELLRVPAADLDRARALLAAAGWDGRRALIVLAPGAAYGTAKQWTLEHVAALAGRLVAERDVTCVLVGSRGDAPATAAVRAAAGGGEGRVVDLAGRTTLGELAGICALASACVSNDSGAMHVAAGVGAPVVAVFGPTNERATAPLVPAGGRLAVLTEEVDCRPCMLRTCPIDHRCMTRLSPARVFDALDAARRGGPER